MVCIDDPLEWVWLHFFILATLYAYTTDDDLETKV